MAGTWMSIIKGFGGMRLKGHSLHFNPFLPKQWTEFSFKINFRANQLNIAVKQTGVEITNLAGPGLTVFVHGEARILESK
jgi:maltose phosphorylase